MHRAYLCVVVSNVRPTQYRIWRDQGPWVAVYDAVERLIENIVNVDLP